MDYLNDAFDSILKRKILVEEEAMSLVNSTVVQNNKKKLTVEVSQDALVEEE